MSTEDLLEQWGARRLSPDEFGKNFRKEWETAGSQFFKYEACQHYTQPGDPSFDALLEGNLYKAARLISEQIMGNKTLYQDAARRSVRLVRVHAVELPLNYYLQYEFMSYLTSQSLGEEIRVADLGAVREVGVGDFLLFDDRVALVHNYVPPDNAQDGGWLVDSDTGLAYLKNCRSILTERSVPLDDFVVPR